MSSSPNKNLVSEEKQPPSHDKLKVTILGAGSYGTAIAVIAARNHHHVLLYCRDKQQSEYINEHHKNNKRLKEYALPLNVVATSNLEDAFHNTDLIISCIPTQFLPQFLSDNKAIIPKDVIFVNTAKGIHVQSRKLLSDIIPIALERDDPKTEKLCYLSGPSFAKEMMECHPMSVTVAANNKQWAKYVQLVLNSMFFRVYITDDVISVEVGGALKNCLAIGAGIATGLGYGQSTIASMITRGAVEIQRMSVAMGGRPETLTGLAGMGDLMLTCFCELSRNRTCGYLIGKEGLSVEDAQKKIGEVVEGVATSKVVVQLMKEYNLRMPLFGALGAILDGSIKPPQALQEIMSSDPDEEGIHSSSNLKQNADE